MSDLPLSPMEELGELAFVNRYAETLDVLFPNLSNQEALLKPTLSLKLMSPLAQPSGTGKTALGQNLIAVLRPARGCGITGRGCAAPAECVGLARRISHCAQYDR